MSKIIVDKECFAVGAKTRVIIGADVLDQGMGRALSNTDKVGVFPHRHPDLHAVCGALSSATGEATSLQVLW